MICYKDMTFCPASACANRKTCGRYLTDEISLQAEATGLPVCLYSDPTDLECFSYEFEIRDGEVV